MYVEPIDCFKAGFPEYLPRGSVCYRRALGAQRTLKQRHAFDHQTGGVGYPEGTCTGSYVRFLNNAILCYPIGLGLDGGLVVGKDQKSGGQEQARSGSNANPGEMGSAFYVPQVYETLATAPMVGARGGVATTGASLNRFDDDSCSGFACLGKVEINTLHLAAGGTVYPGGCASQDCASTSGSGVKTWSVAADRTYVLDILFGDPQITQMQVHLEGAIVPPGNTPPVASAVTVRTTQGVAVDWKPVVSDANADPLTCSLMKWPYAYYGTLKLAPDCSGGTYTPPSSFYGAGMQAVSSFRRSERQPTGQYLRHDRTDRREHLRDAISNQAGCTQWRWVRSRQQDAADQLYRQYHPDFEHLRDGV